MIISIIMNTLVLGNVIISVIVVVAAAAAAKLQEKTSFIRVHT